MIYPVEPLNNPMSEIKSVQCYCGSYWNFVVSEEVLVAGRADRLNSEDEFVYYGARCEHCGRFLLDTYLKKERLAFQNLPLKIPLEVECESWVPWEQSDTELSPEIEILHVSLKESDDILKHWKK
jgi:hypothetical protein